MGGSDDSNNAPPPPESAAAVELSNLELVISFMFGEKEVMLNVVDTPSFHSLSFSGDVSSSSWDHHPRHFPHPCPHTCSCARPLPCPCKCPHFRTCSCLRPCLSPTVPAPMNMSKNMEWGYTEPVVTMAVVGGGTRLGMLTTAAGRVGDEECRRGRNTVEYRGIEWES